MNAAVCGKLPARADFVRIGEYGAPAAEFDQWLVRAVEALSLARQPLPDAVVCFAYHCVNAARLVVGVLAPSQDQLGRKFPVAVFHTWPAQLPLSAYAGLPQTCDDFLRAAEAFTRELPGMQLEHIEQRLGALAPPEVSAWTKPDSSFQQSLQQALRSTLARDFLQRTFVNASADMPYYGLLTVLTAVGSFRSQPSSPRAPVLDFPLSTDLDLSLWLELVARALQSPKAAPSCFWITQPVKRALLALGPAPHDLLLALARPAYTHAGLWPLTTDRAPAVDRARETLAVRLPEVTAVEASVGELIDSISRAAL